MKDEFTKYSITQRHGMEGIGDMELEYLTPQEKEQRWKEYREYQEQCRKENIYSKEYTQTIEIQDNPLFEKPLTPTESYKIVITDFSDENR